MADNTYAILAGGGVKGAALVGCLKAAANANVRFGGYAGTSAGSIVATLAAVGYSPDEVYDLVVDGDGFSAFLDDDGKLLRQAREALSTIWVSRGLSRVWHLFRATRPSSILRQSLVDLGVDSGQTLRNWIEAKISEKIPTPGKSLTFRDLYDQRGIELKIVASDVTQRKARVYSLDHLADEPISEAVRASCCYPFAFRPVSIDSRYVVDGGLCSNLPVFAFSGKGNGSPGLAIAFDLVGEPRLAQPMDGPVEFVRDLLATATEAPDRLLRSTVSRLLYVPIQVPSNIDTLNFDLSIEQRKKLYELGLVEANKHMPKLEAASHSRREVRVVFRQLLDGFIQGILKKLAQTIEKETNATSVRTQVSVLDTSDERFRVKFHHQMSGDSDVHLRLDRGAGCTGSCFTARAPAIADLLQAQTDYATWGLTAEQQAMVKSDRKAMVAVPILDPRAVESGRTRLEDREVLGVLCADTDTPADDAGWKSQDFFGRMQAWADVCARIMSGMGLGGRHG